MYYQFYTKKQLREERASLLWRLSKDCPHQVKDPVQKRAMQAEVKKLSRLIIERRK